MEMMSSNPIGAIIMKLTLAQAATRLGKSERQIRYLIKTNRLRAEKSDGHWFIESEDLPLSEGQQQAVEVLGVSRPYLINLLESDAIPFRKVGRHRRVLMKDVLAYRQTMQVKSKAALRDLVSPSEALGGYDL